jgi:molybdopterin converting factor small subunit
VAQLALAFSERDPEQGDFMAVKVMIPTPLRAYAGKQESVEVSAKTVGEALKGLTDKHGDLKKHLYSDDGKLRSFVNVYVNDEDIRYAQKDQTPVRDGDTVSIVPSIAGGRQN